MTKLFVIAAREYNAVVRSKAFIVSLVLLPVMMFGGIFVRQLAEKVHDVDDKRFAVIDRTPGEQIYPQLLADVAKRNKEGTVDAAGKQVESKFIIEHIPPAQGEAAIDQQRYELSERVRKGDLFAFVEIGEDVATYVLPTPPPKDLPDSRIVRYQTNNPTY